MIPRASGHPTLAAARSIDYDQRNMSLFTKKKRLTDYAACAG